MTIKCVIIVLELCGTLQEDEAFLRAVSIYGSEDISAIQAAVQTRSKVQIRNRVVKVVFTAVNSNILFKVICSFIVLHFFPVAAEERQQISRSPYSHYEIMDKRMKLLRLQLYSASLF